jgi:hypothetical protein
MYRIIGVDQKEYGPVSAEQLRQWIIEGRANAQSMVCLEGGAEWRPLGALVEFSAAFAPDPRVLSSPPFFASTGYRKTNSMALAGMIMGISSIMFGWCCFAWIFPVLGLVFSGVGLSQVNRHPLEQSGRGMAIAGLILSGLTIFVFVILALILHHSGNL